jgi:predicted DNA-binding WGR domain protein
MRTRAPGYIRLAHTRDGTDPDSWDRIGDANGPAEATVSVFDATNMAYATCSRLPSTQARSRSKDVTERAQA